MRLTCPRCGAQYEIDAAAIPPTGREVGCSVCSHTWRAFPLAEPFDPAARPALSRPLSDSVLGILREEAARELGARAAERAAAGDPIPAGAAQDNSGGSAGQVHGREGGFPRGDGIPFPATPPASDPAPRPPSAPASRAATHIGADGAAGGIGLPGGPAPDISLPRSVVSHPGSNDPAASASPRHPAHGAPPPALSKRRARRDYDLGFGLAVAASLVAIALYALAPRLADQGTAGAQLMEWRARVDQGRAALATKAERLLDQGADLVRGSSGN